MYQPLSKPELSLTLPYMFALSSSFTETLWFSFCDHDSEIHHHLDLIYDSKLVSIIFFYRRGISINDEDNVHLLNSKCMVMTESGNNIINMILFYCFVVLDYLLCLHGSGLLQVLQPDNIVIY